MKPADLLDPETLPDDLRWLSADFKLQPKDPVYLLIAWHWHRVQEAEDTLRAASVELQAAVDSRIETIAGTARAVTALSELLAQVQSSLEQRPALISAQVDSELQAPLAKLHALDQSLSSLLRDAQGARELTRRRETLAALLTGVALGLISAAVLFIR